MTSIQGQVSFSAASDGRLKTSVKDIGYGLDILLRMRPVSYELKSNGLKQVGFVAQDMQKLVPEVVTGIEGDLEKGEALAITYSNLVPVLARAIQEQQATIDSQQTMIQQLRNDLHALQERIK